MKIFGFSPLPSPQFVHIKSKEEIQCISAENIVYFHDHQDSDFSLGLFCQQNHVNFAVCISEISSLLLYAHLGAKYAIILGDPLPYQNLAKEYMLDMIILKVIEHRDEISTYALQGIDGVIFKSSLA